MPSAAKRPVRVILAKRPAGRSAAARSPSKRLAGARPRGRLGTTRATISGEPTAGAAGLSAPARRSPARTPDALSISKDGVCYVRRALSEDVVSRVHERVQSKVGEILAVIDSRMAADAMDCEQFREVVCRDGGRLDIRHGMDEPIFCELAGAGAWMRLVRDCLGSDAVLVFCGVVLALGNLDGGEAQGQSWHSDGGHLFGNDLDLPCHCLNVFVPLVDLDASNGPTEFILGSHRPRPEHAGSGGGGGGGGDGGALLSARCLAGTAIVFDYRIKHRGSANRTESQRPMLYFTYSKPWFVDHQNHRSQVSIFENLPRGAAG